MSTAAFHQTHRDLLEAVNDCDVVANAIQLADPGGNAENRWERLWGRIESSNPVHVRLLMRSLVDPTDMRVIDIRGTGTLLDPALRHVEVTKFPDDLMLPTLPATLAANPGSDVIRYRPGRRCTLLTKLDQYVKVFPDNRVERLHNEAAQLVAAADEGRLDFSVAAPLWFAPNMSAFAQATVPGIGISDQLFGPDGTDLAGRVGAAAASLPSSGLRLTQRFGPDVELHRTVRRAEELVAYVPDLEHQLRCFVAAITALHDRLEPAQLRPIHGSPHPQQWLVDGSNLGLVDFDRLALGDPELDVATFLGEVDFERGDHNEICAAFEEGYRARHGDLDPHRLTLYRAHKRFAKVYRTARSVKLNAPDRVAAHLARASDVLSPAGASR